MATINHLIPLITAEAMTKLLRDNRNAILSGEYQDRDILPICETFDADAILSVLNQDNCTSLRIYYGMGIDLKLHAILVGADSSGADILPTGDEVTLEDAVRCPSVCPPASPLNE
jgi:hypothetical protein